VDEEGDAEECGGEYEDCCYEIVESIRGKESSKFGFVLCFAIFGEGKSLVVETVE